MFHATQWGANVGVRKTDHMKIDQMKIDHRKLTKQKFIANENWPHVNWPQQKLTATKIDHSTRKKIIFEYLKKWNESWVQEVHMSW